MNYYYLTAATDVNGNMMRFISPPPATLEERARSLYDNIRFSADAPTAHNRPPSELMVLKVEDGTLYEGKIFPASIETPKAAMSTEMISVINKCGGLDMDLFPVEIRQEDDSVVSHNYRIFKLYNFINKNELDSNPSAMILEGKDMLLFKIEGDYTELYVHERLKKALEDAKIPLLMFHDLSDIITSEELLRD